MGRVWTMHARQKNTWQMCVWSLMKRRRRVVVSNLDFFFVTKRACNYQLLKHGGRDLRIGGKKIGRERWGYVFMKWEGNKASSSQTTSLFFARRPQHFAPPATFFNKGPISNELINVCQLSSSYVLTTFYLYGHPPHQRTLPSFNG